MKDRCTFGEWARMLHLGPRTEVFMLQAYFDDSGDGEKIVGGCIAPVAVWLNFEPEWKAVLVKHGVEWFHAKEHYQNQELIKDLATVLTRHIHPGNRGAGYLCAIMYSGGVSSLKILSARDRARIPKEKSRKRSKDELFVKQLHKKILGMYRDPYCWCMARCLKICAAEFAKPLNETVEIFSAYQPKCEERIAWVYAMAANAPGFAGRFQGFSHGKNMNPRSCIPLQAADFAVYYIGGAKSRRHPHGNEISDRLQPQFIKFTDGYGLQVTTGWI